MVTVSMSGNDWDAIVSAAKAYYEMVYGEDGQPEDRDEVLALGEALDNLQALPAPSR